MSCGVCGLLQVQDPAWLAEAYSDAIAVTDTGLVQRNLEIASRLIILLDSLAVGQKPCLDVAGGYGLLVRLMRDYGFHFRWSDPYCENLLARGFEHTADNGPYAVVTAFEVLEHVEDPLSFVRDALENSGADHMILSTEVFEGAPPDPDVWPYYSLQTGQHISFFQRRTLAWLAEAAGLHFATDGLLHVYSRRPIDPGLLARTSGRFAFLRKRLALRRRRSLTIADHDMMVAQLRQRPGV